MRVDDIEKDIDKKCVQAVDFALNDVHDIMESYMSQYYNEYTPNLYSRTGKLKGSLKLERTGQFSGNVYFDSGFGYNNGMFSGDEVLENAMVGRSPVRKNSINHGARTPVWYNSLFELGFDNFVIEALIKAGL